MALPKYILRRLQDPSGLLAKLWALLFNKRNSPENKAAVQALDLDGDDSVLDLGFGGGASFPYLFDRLTVGTSSASNPRIQWLIGRGAPGATNSGTIDWNCETVPPPI